MLRALLLPGLVGGIVFAAPGQNHPTNPTRLDGVITAADGAPAAHALVVVFSARPRDGRPSTVGTLHHPDCGKHTRTDAQGRFTLPSVNPDLLFRLMVSAAGHRPDYFRDADPLIGGVTLKLRARTTSQDPTRNRVTGKLIDPDGRPVAGARVTVDRARAGNASYSSLNSAAVDPFAVTDEQGLFELTCTNRYPELNVIIDTPHLAKKRLWLATGQAHLIRLKAGLTVSGRALLAGNPIPDLLVSLTTEKRFAEYVLRGIEVATDAQGRFKLVHVPAGIRFLLHTKMKDTAGVGAALLPEPVDAGDDGGTRPFGDLALVPTATLLGRVLLEDGQPVPRRTEITLTIETTGDEARATLDQDGWFEFRDVPKDILSLSVRVSGYRVSAKNPSKDWLNENRVIGRLTQDHEEFIIGLERGQGSSGNPPAGADRQPRTKPLQGAKP